ncbi:MAG TPA: hypothetical protein VKE70_20040 [Candidatus Solibacter sp.]|nr:hypothetical protein [Candidatus Solibacter sp.]
MRLTLVALLACAVVRAAVLKPDAFKQYVEEFNRDDRDHIAGAIPDAEAFEWMKANIPMLSCPDREMERVYYYRWWAYRKHIESTPHGWVLTEFLRPVKHATDYNAISCALGLHVAEGRWLRDRRYIEDYLSFWLTGGEGGGLQRHYHQFSNWTASAVLDRWLADGETKSMLSRLDSLIADYHAWEAERLTPGGLFWQRDVSDGMESSISGGRRERNLRPTINSYMWANAKAIAAMAALAGRDDVRREYQAKAAKLRELFQKVHWNPTDQFFETVREDGKFANVREQIGYTPWAFNLPEQGHGYGEAWKQLMDPKGFHAPYGSTTVEQRHPQFVIARTGDDCQWNGPSWPFATSITLGAVANVLHDYKPQQLLTPEIYRDLLGIYTKSQHLKLADGRVVPFVDENLDPFTGIWLARDLKINKHTFYGRGDHYNHSSYADLIITGLIGLRPRSDSTVDVDPLVNWDWFCLDAVPYHGHLLTILWDKDGRHLGRGAGFRVFADDREIAHSDKLARITGKL